MGAVGFTTGDPNKVDVAGDTMTGDLVLAGPTTDLQVDGDVTVGGVITGTVVGSIPLSIIDAKGDLLVGTAPDMLARLAVGVDGLVLRADPSALTGIVWRQPDPNAFTSGVAVMERLLAASASLATTSMQLRLAYFTAPRAETWNTITASGGSTAAGATPTLCRLGVYSVDGAGNLTLAGACANDTSLFATINTRYARALTSPVVAVAGQRYAHALLIVTAAAMPTLRGATNDVVLTALSPRLGAILGGQADLPAAIAVGALGGSGNVHFGELLP